jgi:hypothetical protein
VSNDGVTHQELLNAILGVGIPLILAIGTLAVMHGRIFFQHKMMWKEFARQHKINGHGREN